MLMIAWRVSKAGTVVLVIVQRIEEEVGEGDGLAGVGS